MKSKICVLLTLALIISSNPVSLADLSSGYTLKPLVILMDYADYKHTQLEAREGYEHVSGLSYSSYETDLYESILFGQDTYTGVDGNDYQTLRAYYNELSHGLLDIEGEVYGWYDADFRARAYGGDQDSDGTDTNDASKLIIEAVDAVVAHNPNLDLSQFDVMDQHDIDGDGEVFEADGEIDCIIVIHAGRGEEYGGGSLEEDAIWPVQYAFQNALGNMHLRPTVDYLNTSIFYNNSIIIEQDFPANLAAHEFAHFLGLPDLYRKGGRGTVEQYSNMSAGYPGELPGSLIPSVGGYCRLVLQEKYGGDWAKIKRLDSDDIDSSGIDVMISAASSDTRSYDDLIRIDLPIKKTHLVDPYQGDKVFYSGYENNANNSMTQLVDLTSANHARLEFMTWYDIESGFDYATVQAKPVGTNAWEEIEGNISTSKNPYGLNPGYGITGDSGDKWIPAVFDLDQFVGQEIELKFGYLTDGNTLNSGMFIDSIDVIVDNKTILSDDVEGVSNFILNGFEVSDGYKYTEHFYLMEWRNHEGIDESLTLIDRKHDGSTSNRGLVVWYIDEYYSDGDMRVDQETSNHLGGAFASVIDAGQYPTMYKFYNRDGLVYTYYKHQRHDAAFSLRREPDYVLPMIAGHAETIDVDTRMQPVFKDSYSYFDDSQDVLSVLQPEYGLEFYVIEENSDSTEGKIHIRNTSDRLGGNTFTTDLDFNGVDLKGDLLTVRVDGEDLEKEATAIFMNEKFPNIIQTDIVLWNKGNEFLANLPLKANGETHLNFGNSYFSGVGDNLDNSMITQLDLTNVSDVELKFSTWFDIDPMRDFASVQVRVIGNRNWNTIEGDITLQRDPLDKDPNDPLTGNPGHGISKDTSSLWRDASFDLSKYANKEIELGIFFRTDSRIDDFGMFIDDIQVIGDGIVLLSDGAEGKSTFRLNGFEVSEHTYRLAHIVFEREDGSYTALFNENVYDGYGVDLTPVFIEKSYTPVSGSAITIENQ